MELELWQSKWACNAEEAKNLNTPENTLVHVDKDFYPNIRSLMMIMVTIPVTSCECEQSISLLILVKSRIRSTMGAERLNALTLMQCHRDVTLIPRKISALTLYSDLCIVLLCVGCCSCLNMTLYLKQGH